MIDALPDHLVQLDVERPLWERFFLPSSLVVIGTRESDGGIDLAPKHMAGPIGWRNFFGFVCTPRHATYGNARRSGAFTVSYPGPDQVVHASLAASPRCDDGGKPIAEALPTFPARRVDGVLLEGARLFLECELERTVDDLGDASLVIGRVVAAYAQPEALRSAGRDDAEVLAGSPLLVYVAPGRFAEIDAAHRFPMPEGLRR